MKMLMVIAFLIPAFAFSRVVEEVSFTMGRHTQESYQLKHYKTKTSQGYAMIKVLNNDRARFERLSQKDYQKKRHQMKQVSDLLQKHRFLPNRSCNEKFKIKTTKDSNSYYCLDRVPKKEKVRIATWWQTGRFN